MARSQNATLNIVIAGDATGARKALKQVEVDASGMTDSLKGAALDAARAFALFEGGKFLIDATQAAANLEQAQALVTQVFGESAKSVQEFAAGADEALGQSERVASDALGTFGLLLTSFGIGEEKAAEWSKALTTLASDMAAVKNISIEEALAALRSGLAGETEPLLKFGVDLRQAALQTEALNLGLIDQKRVLTATERTLAGYSLIMKTTTDIQGQSAREADSLIGQQQRLTAEWENAKAELGNELMPVMKALVTTTRTAVDVFSALPGEVQLGIIAFGGYALVGARVTSALGTAITAAKEMRLAIQGIAATRGISTAAASMEVFKESTIGASSALRTNVGQLNKMTVALSAVTAGVTAYAATTALLNQAVDWKSTGADVDRLTTAFKGLGETQRVQGELADKYGKDLEGLADRIKAQFDRSTLAKLGPTSLIDNAAIKKDIEEVDKAIAALYDQDPEQGRKAFAAVSAALISQGVEAEDVGKSFDRYFEAVEDSTIANKGNKDATEESTESTEEQGEAVLTLTELVKRANDAIRERRDGILAERDALRSAADAHDRTTTATEDLAEATRAATGDSDEYRDAQAEIVDAQEGIVDAHEGVADALEGVQEAEEAVGDAQRGVREAQLALNDAREQAADNIRDMAQAAREAALDEEGAQLALLRAREELAKVLRDPRSDELDKREAELAVREAEAALAAAHAETGDTASESAAAAAAGVEGSPEVLAAQQALRDAREGLTDAEDGLRDAREQVAEATENVRDAEERLGEATDSAAKVIEEAKKRVVTAEQEARDAVLDEAQAWSDLTTEQDGARAGIVAYQRALLLLTAQMAPDGALRQYALGLAADLAAVLNLDPTRFFNALPSDPSTGPAPPGVLNQRGGRERSLSLVQNIYGSDVQTKREMERQGNKWLNAAGIKVSGG